MYQFIVILLGISIVFIDGNAPLNTPVFDNLSDIDDCKGCIVGDNNEQFSVFCRIAEGARPKSVTITIGNDYLTPLESDFSPGYMTFFTLEEKHHMKNITCTVIEESLTSTLRTTSRLYVIRRPKLKTLRAPETLYEGQSADIECIIEDARPAPVVHFNISDDKVVPSSYYISTDPVYSKRTHHFSMTTFKREWNQENIKCCFYNEWHMPGVECTEPKRVNFLYPPADIKLEIKTKPSTPPKLYAVCTLYDSNPIYEVQFTTPSGGITFSEMYSRYYNMSNGAWKAEYAVNLNVSEDEDKVKELTCDAVSPGFNGRKLNMSSTVVVPSNEDTMHWIYRWLIWTILGISFAASVVSLSVFISKQKRVKAKSIKNQDTGRRTGTERVYANILNYSNTTMDTPPCSSSIVNKTYETLNKSRCPGASNRMSERYTVLNGSMCSDGSKKVFHIYETVND